MFSLGACTSARYKAVQEVQGSLGRYVWVQHIHEVLCLPMQLSKIICVKVVIIRHAANFTMLSSCSSYHLCVTRKPVYVPVYLLVHRVCAMLVEARRGYQISPAPREAGSWELLGTEPRSFAAADYSLNRGAVSSVLAKNLKNKTNAFLGCTVVFSYFSLFKRFS